MTTTTEQRCNALIVKKGGMRLDSQWGTVDHPIRIRCTNGHEWSATPASLMYMNSWCPECCRERKRIGLSQVQAVAMSFGGRCLSTEYTNNQSHLEFECLEGHVFSSSTKNLLRGRWCPSCRKQWKNAPGPRSFADAVAKAEKQGGQHIGSAVNLNTKTDWICAKGHSICCSGRSILERAHLCRDCESDSQVTLELIEAECEARGGRCLSPTYKNVDTKMEFECGRGHTWKARWRNVNYNGSWCPWCVREKKVLIAARKVATDHSGVLLSSQSIELGGTYQWQCAEGHRFEASKTEARLNWCPRCSKRSAVHDHIAVRHNGECLSAEQGKWGCEFGHTWRASLSEAALLWCPTCSGQAKPNLPMQPYPHSVNTC